MSTVARSLAAEPADLGGVAGGWQPSLRPPLRRWSRSPVAVAVVVSATLQILWWRIVATGGGDLAAQDAWAEFARLHPGSAYNLSWYGGMHPVSYSVLSPYLMAAVGVRPTLVVAGTLSAGLLTWALVGRHGRTDARALAVGGYAALALVGNAVSGRVTFAVGTVFALVAICLLLGWPYQRSPVLTLRPARAIAVAVASGLATAASPVAGLFLGLVAATLWLARQRWAAYALGVTPVVVVALSALLFPFSGTQPMPWYSTILPVLVGAAVTVTAPASWRAVRLAAALYAPAVLLVWLVPSPIGTNISRLGLLFGGVLMVGAAAGGWRTSALARRRGPRAARGLLVVAVLTASIWQVATAARDVVNASGQTSWGPDVAPILTELQHRRADRGRVEVVPTRSHREAAVFAPHVPLARGWNRQADAVRNPLFYRDQPLTKVAYRRWLHRWAVQYVVLSSAEPDGAAVAETELITSGLPYLSPVWSDENWTLYAVRRPTPLVSPPAKVVSFGAAHLTVYTPRSGDVVIRVADSPWLSLVEVDPLPPASRSSVASWFAAPACLSGLETEDQANAEAHPHRPDWLVLHAPRAGTYRISAPYKLPRGSSCP
ncbi:MULTISPECIES: hypothetical protein [unclassified Nocardioides]|uniref:hypothetical protein n=1 Tax=unclassified Nocardioides TaxID=2615069 RepID=UPI00005710FE|nr:MULTISPECIES: hypothetical protein [unclassified Nocardioides]ABL81289.1 integral membrane protein [Nocardioides sp. JS614]